MQSPLDFIVRVLGDSEDEQPHFRGTGLLVAPDRVLTCRHVIRPRDPPGREQIIENLWVRRADEPCIRVVRAVPSTTDDDLAVLELQTSLTATIPPFLWGVTEALEDKLRCCSLAVIGYAGASDADFLQHPVRERWALPTYADSLLVKVQIHGGIPKGCSGSPALLRLGDRWVYGGIARLGGEGKATSVLLMADRIVAFLYTYGLRSLDRVDAVRALTAAPGEVAGLIEPLGDPEQLPNPYRGLAAFREVDAPYFFGRAADVQALRGDLDTKPLVTLIGPSGSGKSSLVFAGLMPQLRAQGDWMITAFRPKRDPFEELASALARLLFSDQDPQTRRKNRNQLFDDLTSGALTIGDEVAILAEVHPDKRLLLIADQFEEFYSPHSAPEGTRQDQGEAWWDTPLAEDCRRQFLDGLLAAVRGQDHPPNFILLLTLRADFLEPALKYGPFADALQTCAPRLLGPLDDPALLEDVITVPARQLGVALESGLMETILKDLGPAPGKKLPLLEFALAQLWQRQTQRQLTHAAYTDIGGVDQALARHADQTLQRLLDEGFTEDRLRRVFMQLVRPGEGIEDTTRQVATREQVAKDNWSLVSRLADARLVVTGHDQPFKGGQPKINELQHKMTRCSKKQALIISSLHCHL